MNVLISQNANLNNALVYDDHHLLRLGHLELCGCIHFAEEQT